MFTIETRASTITTSAPGYGYALRWSDAVVDPLLHVVDNHCTVFPILCSCTGPTAFTAAGVEGVTGSCVRTSAAPSGPPPPIATGEVLVTSTLTCAAPGTTVVAMLGPADSSPGPYASLRDSSGTPIATGLENQVANPSAPPATVAGVNVVCYESADAGIVKTAPPDATEGDTIAYTLTLTNPHPTIPLDIDVSDLAPSGVTFVGFTESDPGACSLTASSLTCTDFAVAPAGTGTITIDAQLDTCDLIDNSATITGVSSPTTTVLDLVAANDSSSASTLVVCTVDASIAKNGPASVLTGGTGTYVISITNPDTMPAIEVTVADTAPVGVTFTAVDHPGCMITGGSLLTCSIAIPPLASATINLDATFTGCVAAINTAALVVVTPIDPNPANNAAVATTEVLCLVDAAIVKTGPQYVHPTGSVDTYVIEASNPDPTFTLNTQVLDIAPPGVTFNSVDHPACLITGGVTLQCTLVVLPSSTETVNVTATFGVCGLAPNTATLVVGAPILDPNPVNNVSTTVASVCGSPDIDGDGCTEFEELGPDHRFGGQRIFVDPNDFFDVPGPAAGPIQPDGKPVLSAGAVRNKAISLVDVGVVLAYVGRTSLNPAYTADHNGDLLPDGTQLDRTPTLIAGELWRAGLPNGVVSLQDVAVALASVGDNCQAIPN